jgi:DNA-binding transcriptional ArsR family regulator
LAHPDRLRLILALGDDELSLNHLADITEQSPAAVRQHLESLERVGVVRSRRHRDRPFYQLSEPEVRTLTRRQVRRGGEVAGRTRCTGAGEQGLPQPTAPHADGRTCLPRITAMSVDAVDERVRRIGTAALEADLPFGLDR